jgi:hypothetical protein
MRFQSRVALFNHRTKTEHLATILLPNPVAAHDTSRHAMDGVIEISKENSILWNRSLRAEMGAAAFECGAFDHSATFPGGSPRSSLKTKAAAG